MKIANESVVSFHFTLRSSKGDVIETSAGNEPLVYLHGAHNIVPGLEEALTGRSTGDKFQVTLPPEKGYGARDERLVQTVPRTQFPPGQELKPGMQFQANTQGGMVVLTITSVDDKEVVVDGNPELAGQTLHFEIEVTEVRKASAEELAHGHAHGPGGHQHH